MKKVVALTVLIAFLLTFGSAYAGVLKIIKKEVRQTVTTEVNNYHRYVKGYARYSIGPTFLRNDWDRGNRRFTGLTQEEKGYLNTLTGFSRRTWYYIDLTSQTVSTAPFQDSSTSTITGTDESTTYEVDPDNPLNIIVTHTIITYVTVENTIYQLVASVYDYSPIVLDLNKDKILDVAENNWKPHAPKFHTKYAKFFDMTGSGSADFTEWLAPGGKDGLLVMPNKDGKVETALELFGTAGGYDDGYQKLSIVCDSDKNGWIEGKELEGLAVWTDLNGDAICQPTELKKLESYNITKISAKHSDYVSKYVTSDGSEHITWDWWPSVMETRKFRRN